ncbi:MAG TPA: hypothetical protein VL572_03460 [Pyrinomonadaceae bacterium]|nr:hypothetical protein [Pyrinomonadaceae bacterium]
MTVFRTLRTISSNSSRNRAEWFYDLETFWYVANDAFNDKTGKDLYEYIDHDNDQDRLELISSYPAMFTGWT